MFICVGVIVMCAIEFCTIELLCAWYQSRVVLCELAKTRPIAVALSTFRESFVIGSRRGGIMLCLFVILFVICQNCLTKTI